MTIKVTGKTINVTGFDYTENAVTATTKEGVTPYSGAKLIVTIPIRPDITCTAWQAGERVYPTNSTAAGSKAGLSNYTDQDGKAADPTLLDQSPEVNVTAYTVTYEVTGEAPETADYTDPGPISRVRLRMFWMRPSLPLRRKASNILSMAG